MAPKDFRQDLAGIRQQLDVERLRQQEAARAQRALAAERQRNSRLFRDAVGDAVPLAQTDRAAPARPRLVPRPLNALARAPVTAVAQFSDGPDDIGRGAFDASEEYARDGLDQRALRRLRRGDWPVSGQLDLHGMTRDQARNATESFLRSAVDQRWRCVRLIHGKGLGSAERTPILKMLVRRWLRQSAQVLAFTVAPVSAGGGGALLILVKPAGLQPTATN